MQWLWLLWGYGTQVNCWLSSCSIWTLTHIHHLCRTAQHILWMVCIVVVSVIPIRCQPQRQKPHIALLSCHLQVVCLAHYIPHCLVKHVPYDDMHFFVLQLLQVLQANKMEIRCLFHTNIASTHLMQQHWYWDKIICNVYFCSYKVSIRVRLKRSWFSEGGTCTSISNKVRVTNMYAIPIFSHSF
jgi:hypothetical protein